MNENWQLEWSFLIVVQGLDEWICVRGEKKREDRTYADRDILLLYTE